MNNYILVRSNIIQVGKNLDIVKIDMKLPNKYDSNNIVFGKVFNIFSCRYVKNIKIKLVDRNDSQKYYDTLTNNNGEYLFFNIPNSAYYYMVMMDDEILIQKSIDLNDEYIINNFNVVLCDRNLRP